jgi:hypothetical protein
MLTFSLHDWRDEFNQLVLHAVVGLDESFSSFKSRDFLHPWNGILKELVGKLEKINMN